MIYSGYFEYKRENCEWVSSGAMRQKMTDRTKKEIVEILNLLKADLIMNGVSMALGDEGTIYFFDTENYVDSGIMDGFAVNINSLVRFAKENDNER